MPSTSFYQPSLPPSLDEKVLPLDHNGGSPGVSLGPTGSSVSRPPGLPLEPWGGPSLLIGVKSVEETTKQSSHVSVTVVVCIVQVHSNLGSTLLQFFTVSLRRSVSFWLLHIVPPWSKTRPIATLPLLSLIHLMEKLCCLVALGQTMQDHQTSHQHLDHHNDVPD